MKLQRVMQLFVQKLDKIKCGLLNFIKLYIQEHLFLLGDWEQWGLGSQLQLEHNLEDPDKLVFDIAGDGSIQMNSHEFATAIVNKLPIKIILLNNGYLGMVKQWQKLFYAERYSETCIRGCVDFIKLIEAWWSWD